MCIEKWCIRKSERVCFNKQARRNRSVVKTIKNTNVGEGRRNGAAAGSVFDRHRDIGR